MLLPWPAPHVTGRGRAAAPVGSTVDASLGHAGGSARRQRGPMGQGRAERVDDVACTGGSGTAGGGREWRWSSTRVQLSAWRGQRVRAQGSSGLLSRPLVESSPSSGSQMLPTRATSRLVPTNDRRPLRRSTACSLLAPPRATTTRTSQPRSPTAASLPGDAHARARQRSGSTGPVVVRCTACRESRSVLP